MVYCSDCGTEAADSQSYCQSCGSSLSVDGGGPPSDGNSASTIQQQRKTDSLDDAELKERLQSMDEYEFEYFIGDLWEKVGWRTEVSQASADAGIDVIAEKDKPYHQKKVIQAKRYGENTTVGGPDIQQYASLKRQVPNTDSVVIVTTSSFTSSAKSRADELNVKLVDGDGLVDMVRQYDAGSLVDQYTDLSTSTEQNTQSEPTPSGYVPTTEDSVAETSTKPKTEPLVTGFAGFNKWHYVAAVAVLLTYAMADVSDGALLIFYFLGIITLYLDIRYVRKATDYSPRAWPYLLGMVFALAIIVVPAYLINRFRYTN
ncbi:hypothetical protein DVK00_03205 [Haloarcula sp. Atlit-47R]|nr:hypothetical protein DVK00_03205 [Haloarcula sp. Atlit-47R]